MDDKLIDVQIALARAGIQTVGPMDLDHAQRLFVRTDSEVIRHESRALREESALLRQRARMVVWHARELAETLRNSLQV